ncbi:aminopeptidase [Candidatus Woesearchaeota archaeon]|nr:aminopeptidase [Candidatus Woesearchaeota archaeon]
MGKLERAADLVLKKCMGLKPKENLLIIVDKRKRKIGKLFLKQGKKTAKKAKLLEIPVGKVNGEEPPKKAAKEMIKYDVELLITTKSLTHTKARKNASKTGARIATLPDITESMMKRAINVDYNRIQKLSKKIADVIDRGKTIRVLTKKGTDIIFYVKGRKSHGRGGGILTKKGKFGNLPSGEAFIAPVENKTSGIYIVDASLGGIGKVDMPVRVLVKNGCVIKITGKKSAKELNKLLKGAGKRARVIAELGIGTNYKAKLTGNLLEDEKAIGTCHIALGDNTGFGGKNEVPLHIDGVIKKPTIFVDNRKIMDNGKLVI